VKKGSKTIFPNQEAFLVSGAMQHPGKELSSRTHLKYHQLNFLVLKD
jgi:hypothetical protein